MKIKDSKDARMNLLKQNTLDNEGLFREIKITVKKIDRQRKRELAHIVINFTTKQTRESYQEFVK